MNVQWMMEEIVAKCQSEFKAIVEKASAEGLGCVASLEASVLTRSLHFGAAVVSKILQGLTEAEPSSCRCHCCQAPARSEGHRPRTARTLLGKIVYERRVFSCSSCHLLFAPMDRELGLAKAESLTAHAKEEAVRLAAEMPFESASDVLGRLTGLDVSGEGVRKLAEKIGARVAAAREAAALLETCPDVNVKQAPKTLVVQADGVMGRFDDDWHEAMVGATARIVGPDPKRDGGVKLERLEVTTIPRNRELFWRCLDHAAQRSGLGTSHDVVFIGDAGGGNFDAVQAFAPNAVQILDFYHAAKHLDDALKAIFGPEGDEAAQLFDILRKRLKEKNGADAMIKRLERLKRQKSKTLPFKASADLDREIAYFRKNRYRMRYAYFRSKGWPIGSGLIEGSCKSVFQERFKKSGMTWSTSGMTAIAAARDALLSGTWDQRVKPRLAA